MERFSPGALVYVARTVRDADGAPIDTEVTAERVESVRTHVRVFSERYCPHPVTGVVGWHVWRIESPELHAVWRATQPRGELPPGWRARSENLTWLRLASGEPVADAPAGSALARERGFLRGGPRAEADAEEDRLREELGLPVRARAARARNDAGG